MSDEEEDLDKEMFKKLQEKQMENIEVLLKEKQKKIWRGNKSRRWKIKSRTYKNWRRCKKIGRRSSDRNRKATKWTI